MSVLNYYKLRLSTAQDWEVINIWCTKWKGNIDKKFPCKGKKNVCHNYVPLILFQFRKVWKERSFNSAWQSAISECRPSSLSSGVKASSYDPNHSNHSVVNARSFAVTTQWSPTAFKKYSKRGRLVQSRPACCKRNVKRMKQRNLNRTKRSCWHKPHQTDLWWKTD